jgi:hypothetical protein
MGIRRFDPDAWIGDSGIQLIARGEELLIRARFSRRSGNLEVFLSELKSAILLWIRHHPHPSSASTDARPKQNVPRELGALRLPKTAGEEKELKTIAAQGPGAVYKWIYGPESLITKAMAGTTWTQFGVENATEGCERIVRSILDHQADLRAVRPNLRAPR